MGKARQCSEPPLDLPGEEPGDNECQVPDDACMLHWIATKLVADLHARRKELRESERALAAQEDMALLLLALCDPGKGGAEVARVPGPLERLGRPLPAAEDLKPPRSQDSCSSTTRPQSSGSDCGSSDASTQPSVSPQASLRARPRPRPRDRAASSPPQSPPVAAAQPAAAAAVESPQAPQPCTPVPRRLATSRFEVPGGREGSSEGGEPSPSSWVLSPNMDYEDCVRGSRPPHKRWRSVASRRSPPAFWDEGRGRSSSERRRCEAQGGLWEESPNLQARPRSRAVPVHQVRRLELEPLQCVQGQFFVPAARSGGYPCRAGPAKKLLHRRASRN